MKCVGATLEFCRSRLKARALLSALTIEPILDESIQEGISIRFVTGSPQSTNNLDIIEEVVTVNITYAVAAGANRGPTATQMALGSDIETALHGASGTVTDGRVLICEKKNDLFFPKRENDGQTWFYLGATFELVVQVNA